MFVVGLSGSLKTGKSTVAAMFVELGAFVVDADKIAHQEMTPQGSCYRPIVKVFGQKILNEDGMIDRKKLSGIVFKDRAQLNKLMKIIHPAVKKEIRKVVQSLRGKQGILVLDVPLLFESGLHKEVDVSVVVKAHRQKQITRAVRQLKISKVQAGNRIKAQMPLKAKIRLANFIIDNNGTINQTRKQVVQIWDELSQKTQKKRK
ncbi:MAG: dephospho-CoA kinase [Candidatus Omnitrophica bacterium]|nr:dephospho-CoA kinase [Candidatus Omnitrophota bacterium]